MAIIAHPIRRCTAIQQMLIRAIAHAGYIRTSELPGHGHKRSLETLRNHGLIEREWDRQAGEDQWHITPATRAQIEAGY